MNYPGGKNGAGTFHKIINQIPPHRVTVEGCAGSAAILRRLRPAERSIVVEVDREAIRQLSRCDELPPATELVEVSILDWLPQFDWRPDCWLYLDPPYLPETRTKRRIYRYEWTEEDHRRLLNLVVQLPALVAISGYWSRMYARALRGWRTIHWPAITRGGVLREEFLWMNYPEPDELHDYRFLGQNYRERENLRRQQRRWATRLARMDRLQRLALLAALQESSSPIGDT